MNCQRMGKKKKKELCREKSLTIKISILAHRLLRGSIRPPRLCLLQIRPRLLRNDSRPLSTCVIIFWICQPRTKKDVAACTMICKSCCRLRHLKYLIVRHECPRYESHDCIWDLPDEGFVVVKNLFCELGVEWT